jgi:hypothetical protein
VAAALAGQTEAGVSCDPSDEVLALAETCRTDSVILTVEEALQRKAVDELSSAERTVLVVEALEREVNNGGYNQFFLNEAAFARCADTARISRDAGAVLDIQPEWTIEQMQDAAADSTDEQDARLGEMDDDFFAYPDPIEDRFVKAS